MSQQHSFELIFSQLSKVTADSLWVLDENPPQNLPAPNPFIKVISNRFDVVALMKSRGFNAIFSDFCFNSLADQSYQYIFFRISKEKALAHHIINSAARLLKPQGRLVLSGAKQEGIKGYIERTAKLYSKLEILKADKQHWGAIFEPAGDIEQPLDDKNYSLLRASVTDSKNFTDFEFHSKPGIFGWNKIDAGSALLIEHLATLYHNAKAPTNVLDIGCGYGYLSVRCAALFKCRIVASDNNAAAVIACRENLSHSGVEHQVIATNCTQNITEKFDLILCNPPFHTGFEVENDLTDQFLKGAKARLSEQGMAIFVVNLHIPLERKAQCYFKNITKLSSDQHFKVVRLDNI